VPLEKKLKTKKIGRVASGADGFAARRGGKPSLARGTNSPKALYAVSDCEETGKKLG